MALDWNEILNNLVVFLSGSALSWIFYTVVKLRKDVDHAHAKIRKVCEKLNLDCPTTDKKSRSE